MPTVYFYDKDPIDMSDQEYAIYNRTWVNPPNPDPNQRETSMQAYDTGPDGSLIPVSQKPKPGNLQDYLGSNDPNLYGQVAQYGAQTGAATAAGYGAAAAIGPWAGPLGGLWLMAGDAIMKGVHGDSWSPDKYKTLTAASRNDYLNEMATPENRARNLGDISTEYDGPDNQRLTKYLADVQPYEDMVYYNPRTLSGKNKSYAYTEWAKQHLRSNWRRDVDSIEAQELAARYGLALPQGFDKRSPMSVDPASFK
jgi:hypothetical protein